MGAAVERLLLEHDNVRDVAHRVKMRARAVCASEQQLRRFERLILIFFGKQQRQRQRQCRCPALVRAALLHHLLQPHLLPLSLPQPAALVVYFVVVQLLLAHGGGTLKRAMKVARDGGAESELFCAGLKRSRRRGYERWDGHGRWWSVWRWRWRRWQMRRIYGYGRNGEYVRSWW